MLTSVGEIEEREDRVGERGGEGGRGRGEGR